LKTNTWWIIDPELHRTGHWDMSAGDTAVNRSMEPSPPMGSVGALQHDIQGMTCTCTCVQTCMC
jgi:hypothetical protein